MMQPQIIGITGGIGCGKSALCNYFSQLGYPVIDTDQVAKALVKPGQPGLVAIIEALGKDYLLQNGELNRDKLRQTFFNNPQIKQQVEAQIHPLVRQYVAQQIELLRPKHRLIFIAIPVIHQLNQPEYQLDYVLLVECDAEKQLERVQQRDGRTPEQIHAIMQNQATPEQRQARADGIIYNNTDLNSLHQQAYAWLQKMLA